MMKAVGLLLTFLLSFGMVHSVYHLLASWICLPPSHSYHGDKRMAPFHSSECLSLYLTLLNSAFSQQTFE
uniref:Secreted protein n=1 Tax=Anguilla anguilla TaxID=7936 RepID=A0A0E9WQV2_ANGAN